MANVAEGLHWLRTWNNVWEVFVRYDPDAYFRALAIMNSHDLKPCPSDEFMLALVEVLDELLVE